MYSLGCRPDVGSSDYELLYWANGVENAVGTPQGTSFDNGEVMKLRIQGSTLTVFNGVTEEFSETDTNLTGHKRGGLFGKSKAGNDNAHVNGDWVLTDTPVAGTGIRNPFGGPMVLRKPLGA